MTLAQTAQHEFNPMLGERLAPAWTALIAHLADGQPHGRLSCIDAMLAASDVQRKTCLTLIAKGRHAGWLTAEPRIDGLVQLTARGKGRWL